MVGVATTDQKARLLDLTTGVLKMVQDGARNMEHVLTVLQKIKDSPRFILDLTVETDLLKFVGTESVTGAKNFVCDNHAIKETSIGRTGANFDRLFKGKIEVGVPGTQLNIHELKKHSVHGPILEELGGKKQARIHLAIFLNFLKNKKKRMVRCLYQRK